MILAENRRIYKFALLGGVESRGLGGFYFWRKPNEAKTLFWVLRTDYFLNRFCDSQNLNRSNGGGGFVFFEIFGIELD